MRFLFADGFAWPSKWWALLLTNCSFIATTAVAGGVGLAAGAINPGEQLLEGSIFNDYSVPGLALVIVGVVAFAATVLLVIEHPASAAAAAAVGALMVVYEIVEVWTIGSPGVIAGSLQLFYTGLGLTTLLAGLGVRAPEHRSARHHV
jgi:hypothetical protein